jgi:hypothetical protein
MSAYRPRPPSPPPRRLVALAIAAAVLAAAPAARADDAKPAPKPACIAPEHRQFDFWLGDWDVRDGDGKLVGRNVLTPLHGGCALLENWTGNGGTTGTSLNLWDAETHRWHQTWVDSGGGLLLLDGGFADGRMVLTGAAPPGPGAPDGTLNRITWAPLPDGRVRQQWESSTDKGRTWKSAFDGYYTKRR